MQVTKQIAVELLDGGNVPPIVYAKQNDRQTRFVAASLYENGQPFEPPSGVLAEFRAKKPDGTACFYDVNEDGEPAIVIEGSVVTAELAEQVLTAAGKVYAEINLYSSAGEKLTTFSFVIIVEPSVLTDAEIVSSDYYNILSAQIKAAQDAAQDAQTAAQNAQSYAGQAEETLQEVEQLADTVSGTIQQAGQEQVAAVQQAGQTQVSSVTQAGQEQITAVQQAGAQQTAAAAAEAARAKGYADSAEETLQEVEQLADTVSGTIQQAGQEQVAAVQQAGQTQVSSVTQAGQEQITAVQQAGAQQTAAAAAEADRAKGYADSIDPSQFVKTVNGEEPDASGNVEVQAGVASVFGRTGAVTAQAGDYDAGQIDETSSRVFVSPQEKAKWNAPGDLINGTLSVWQRYNAADSSTYTNPSNAYIADRFRSNGTGTVKPNARGYGADITGTVTMQYWMEKSDFALLPDPVVVYYSVGGEMQSTSTAKTSVPTDSDGNACVFSQAITNQTLDWVSLYPGRPVRPYAEELALCQRYYQFFNRYQSNANEYVASSKMIVFKLNRLSMRIKPTVSLIGTANSAATGGYYVGTANGGGIYTGSTFSTNPVTEDLVQIRAVLSSSNTASLNCVINFATGAGIALDAEIY